MLYIWLHNWHQTIMKVALILIVLVNILPLTSGVANEDGLSAWWVGEVQRSGFGHLEREVVRQHVPLPDWWDKVRLSWKWSKAGIWLGIAGGLGWQLMCGWGANWVWWVVVATTHQARTALGGVEQEIWSQLSREVVSVSEIPAGMVSMARVSADEALEQASAELKLDVQEGSSTSNEEKGSEGEEAHQEPGKGTQSAPPGEVMMLTLGQVVEKLPIGTNQGLLHMLWMLVSGQLLYSRGAIFPALQRLKLSDKAVRRAWVAFAKGAWQISDLLEEWQVLVEKEGVWREHQIEGYRVKTVDLTAFWRPELKNNPFKHYHPQAGKAIPAIVVGIVARVGQMGEQRVPLPTLFVRSDEDDPVESKLVANLLLQVAQSLGEKEVAVLDAGFKVSGLQQAGVKRYTVRLAKNATVRRNVVPEYTGKGRPPEKGEAVRPLARSYRGKTIAATPSDREESWREGKLTLRAEFWENLVLFDQKPETEEEKGSRSFNVVAIHDPRYKEPLLLATPLKLKGESLREIYRDRWPVEQIPLAAKQMIGAARQFVHAEESRHRLPELSLFAGSVLTYVAAKLPPIPTGFWDRAPRSTPGRLRRALDRAPLSSNLSLPARIRKKASVTDHLPKGILGDRRQPRAP